MQASDGERGWEGSLSETELEVLASRSKMDVQVYITDTVKALSRQNLGSLSFLYSMKLLEKNKIQLVWKKHILSENIKFQLGEMQLYGVHATSTAAALLDFAVTSMDTLQNGKTKLEAKCERLGKERQEVLHDLQECVNIQEKVEKELFSKFKLVLNEKKTKIRNLMESVQHLKEENEELRCKLWSSGSCDASSQREKVVVPDATTTPATSAVTNTPAAGPPPTHTTDSTKDAMTSLLDDVQCRAPSPPPAKRRRNTKSRKTVVDLERPLAKPRAISRASPVCSSADKELDSDQLLDML